MVLICISPSAGDFEHLLLFAGHSFAPTPFFHPFISSVHFSIGYLGFFYELMLTVYFRHFYVVGHLC